MTAKRFNWLGQPLPVEPLGLHDDLDFLDTLVICSQNKMNMNQAFGRILRRLFAFPYVVIDFDDVTFFPGMFRHRLKQYKERLPGADTTIKRWKRVCGSFVEDSVFDRKTSPPPAEEDDSDKTIVYKRRRHQ